MDATYCKAGFKLFQFYRTIKLSFMFISGTKTYEEEGIYKKIIGFVQYFDKERVSGFNWH